MLIRELSLEILQPKKDLVKVVEKDLEKVVHF